MIEELSKNQLDKANVMQVKMKAVLVEAGEIHAYNKDLDKARTYKAITL